MVSQCVNPKCGKVLHYLRDGKIFLLNVRADDGSNVPRMEHFWLCGECSANYMIRQSGNRVEVILKARSRRPAEMLTRAAIALAGPGDGPAQETGEAGTVGL